MVFHLGNKYGIALFKKSFCNARGCHVYSTCSARGEDYAPRIGGIEVVGYRKPCLFVVFCRLLAEKMHPAVYICIVVIVRFAHGCKQTSRLLGSGRIVKVDEFLIVYTSFENREF